MKKAFDTLRMMTLTAVLAVASAQGATAQTTADNTAAKTAPRVAQPLFITPYKPNVATYESGMPAFVKGRNTNRQPAARTYTQANRKSGPILYDATNQFRSDIGRITSEKTFYDAQTDRTYKQYAYMGLLAERGDTETLRQVLADVQSNGVFDPVKYQAAVSGAQGGGGTTQAGGGSATQTGADGARRSYVMKAGDSELPQKVHRGYDEEDKPVQAVQQKPRGKQPIFLHQ